MTFKSRLTTAIATGAVLVNALAPIALADTVTVSGNGSFSSNGVNVSNSNTTEVSQTNNANISNHVNSNSSTGGNNANYNTGGDSSVKTGSASNTVTVNNAVNANSANVSCSTCGNGATDVKIAGNGDGSQNGVNTTSTNTIGVTQTNNANVHNDIDVNSSTGGNNANYNTGGDSSIQTGSATTNVDVTNAANANVAHVGGRNGSATPSSITISGNGVYSSNAVNMDESSLVELNQSNDAHIKNDVDVNAKTGNNDANYNTTGDSSISTGDATTGVTVDNAVNFNGADVSCDCVLGDGLNVLVDKNGVHSDNGVNATSDNQLFPVQANNAGLWNDADGNAKTGGNDAAYNTGDAGDPSVSTGASTSNNTVNNAGNVNTLGNLGDVTVGTTFDLSGLMAFINGLFA